ncbi:hypothetical protein ACJX0J_007865, partial [Zea mays]
YYYLIFMYLIYLIVDYEQFGLDETANEEHEKRVFHNAARKYFPSNKFTRYAEEVGDRQQQQQMMQVIIVIFYMVLLFGASNNYIVDRLKINNMIVILFMSFIIIYVKIALLRRVICLFMSFNIIIYVKIALLRRDIIYDVIKMNDYYNNIFMLFDKHFTEAIRVVGVRKSLFFLLISILGWFKYCQCLD